MPVGGDARSKLPARTRVELRDTAACTAPCFLRLPSVVCVEEQSCSTDGSDVGAARGIVDGQLRLRALACVDSVVTSGPEDGDVLRCRPPLSGVARRPTR